MERAFSHECLHREFLLRYGILSRSEIYHELIENEVAGIGMVISAQWELVLGNSFGYTTLSAFGQLLNRCLV